MCILAYPIIWTMFSKLNSGKWCSTVTAVVFEWVWHTSLPRVMQVVPHQPFRVVSVWEWHCWLVKLSLILSVIVRRTVELWRRNECQKQGCKCGIPFTQSTQPYCEARVGSRFKWTCHFCFILALWLFGNGQTWLKGCKLRP